MCFSLLLAKIFHVFMPACRSRSRTTSALRNEHLHLKILPPILHVLPEVCCTFPGQLQRRILIYPFQKTPKYRHRPLRYFVTYVTFRSELTAKKPRERGRARKKRIVPLFRFQGSTIISRGDRINSTNNRELNFLLVACVGGGKVTMTGWKIAVKLVFLRRRRWQNCSLQFPIENSFP